jgi:predicted RNase H-like nuclease (RuvC/YqgF family)
MAWLAQTPAVVVEAHLVMLDRLQAEESMARTTEVAVGRSLKPGGWIRNQWQAWRRRSGRVQRAVKPTRDALAAAGIGVREVSRG